MENRYKTFTWIRGSNRIIEDINNKFDTLRNEIPAELPMDFPVDELLNYINNLKSNILDSESKIAGIHFFASQDDESYYRRAVCLGVVASDYQQLSPISDAFQNKMKLEYQEAWDQTLDIGLGVSKIYSSQLGFKAMSLS